MSSEKVSGKGRSFLLNATTSCQAFCPPCSKIPRQAQPSIQERKVLGVSWSDDLILLVEEKHLQAVLDAVAELTSRIRQRVELTKMFLVPLFPNGLKWAAPDATITDETTEVKTTRVTIGGNPLKVKKSAKLLGRLFRPKVHQHKDYVKQAKKATAPASQMMSGLGAFQPTASLKLAEFLYIALLQSVLVSRLTNCQLDDTDYDTLRATQCNICRKATWAGKRVSQFIILREVGWTPLDVAIIMAKIGLHNRLKRLDPREYASTVLVESMEAVRRGTENGLAFETKMLWQKLGNPGAWETTLPDSLTEKKQRKSEVKRLIQRKMDAWITTHSSKNGHYAEQPL